MDVNQIKERQKEIEAERKPYECVQTEVFDVANNYEVQAENKETDINELEEKIAQIDQEMTSIKGQTEKEEKLRQLQKNLEF